MSSYFYRGRHRRPTDSGKRVAIIAGATILSASSSAIISGSVANAATTMPTALRNAIIACESGGKNVPTSILNANGQRASTAGGYYQITDPTWRDNGGLRFASRALFASAAEQAIVADTIYSRRGTQPWDSSKGCWSRRIGTAPTSTTSQNAPSRTKVVTGTKTPTSVYVVKRGDTLQRIADANGVSGGWRTIYNKNRGVVENPNLIFPGERLVLR